MRQIEIVLELGSEIITTTDAKNYARVETGNDDTLIGYMITSARIQAENYMSRDIKSKRRTYYLDNSLDGIIDLPFCSSNTTSAGTTIESVKIDGVVTTDYEVRGLDDKIVIIQPTDKRIEITYVTSGMNDGLLKQVLLQMVTTLYDNRTDYVNGTISTELDSNYKRILDGYKSVWI